MTLQDSFLRKAAVLIATLDDQAADSLLEQIGRDQAALLQRMLGELAPVTLDERSQVIQEFLQAGMPPLASARDCDAVEVDDSLAARFAADRRLAEDEPAGDTPGEDTPGEAAEESPFSFLAGASPETLAARLDREHPQTISVVLSQLPPAQVSETLRCLPDERRGEVLQRLSCFQETDESVVAEIARELQQSFPGSRQRRCDPPAAPARARAIPEATGAAGRDPRSARSPARPARQNASSLPAAHPAPEPPVPFEFDDLNALEDSALAMVLGRADPEAAIVALTAADPGLRERIQRQLPWREARELKRQIERLGPIRLSDVERAQQRVAEIARLLIQQGVISPPKNRGFITAA